MAIPLSEARGLYTKKLLAVYQEFIKPKTFLRSFFPSEYAPTKEVSIEVERGFEKVAVDIVRGSDGNFNTFSKSTEKIFVPPYWREYFTATDLDVYDRVLGSQASDNSQLFAKLVRDTAGRIAELQAKIERAKELMCAQVLHTGIVTTRIGENIDFKRKAASMVDLVGAGGYWTTGATDVFAQIKAGCEFLRTVGKCGDGVFMMVLGGDALDALLKNTTFLTRQNLFNMALDAVKTPTIGSVGAAFHGTLTAGSYKVQLWTYPEFYDNTSGVSTPYVDNNKAILMPPAPKFIFANALVPQLVSDIGAKPVQTGEWVIGERIDEWNAKHDFDIKSAGLPIPVAVDQIYTMQVKA